MKIKRRIFYVVQREQRGEGKMEGGIYAGLEEKMPFPNFYAKEITPTAKQKQFLEELEEKKEVFFGGAAGGGKSVALLLAAMEYIRFPGYSALILRKDLRRMELAGGLIQRSHQWFGGKKCARWVESRKQWFFPFWEDKVPAMIMFGYLNRPLDKFRYASSEFQYIAFDELTEIAEEDYLFLFSRLRRNTSLKVPLRMRSASNPGGPGHAWVKERFIAGARKREPEGWYEKEGRIYLPSRIIDNEHLSEEEYRETLLHLPAVERERLMNGDWSVQERGVFRADSLRYFVEQPACGEEPAQMELLDRDNRILATIPEGRCHRFVTIDPAGTSAERTREAKGGRRSWTVMQVWDQPRRELSRFLILRHQVRKQVGFDGLCELICEIHREWRPERIWIEREKLGQAAYDTLRFQAPIECLSPGVTDKSTRSGALQIKLSKGEVFLPKHENSWRPGFEAELLAWTGDERQTADQIDAAAYAAIVVRDYSSGVIRVM